MKNLEFNATLVVSLILFAFALTWIWKLSVNVKSLNQKVRNLELKDR